MTKYISFITIITAFYISGFISPPKAVNYFQNLNSFGYIDRGDSIEFRFGDQKKIKIGMLDIDLDKRRAEIKTVNLAGDFNAWSANNSNFTLKQVDAKIYKIVLPKKSIGQKGETHKFKFVLNGKYWIEPPHEALNIITGADHNTNLIIKIN
jgi:hypothetical protein